MIVPGPRVVILYEDKTAGGLHHLISRMVEVRRGAQNRDRFSYFQPLPMKANAKLIEACRTFERMRFFGPHRADHVFAVIDGYEVENVVPSAPQPPTPGQRKSSTRFEQYCRSLSAAVRSHLSDLALEKMTPERRGQEVLRFHPHVLLWERESVLLAGGDILGSTSGLALPADQLSAAGILRTRHPTPLIEAAWARRFPGDPGYSKADDGPRLFGHLADHQEQWPTLLDRIPCLRDIVDELAVL
jgi:hypothetical protein